MSTKRLSDVEHWSDRWESTDRATITFDPRHLSKRDIHRFLSQHLPQNADWRCVEIGCHPGSWLWYFNTVFRYQVGGIEYVDWCAEETAANLAGEGISAEIKNADFFDVSDVDAGQWDVVFSSGFVEHFEDTTDVVKRHGNLCAPGGLVVVLIPNHAGVYGPIMKKISPEKHSVHNLMSLDDLVAAVSRTDLELVAAEYLGRIGFWSCCMYETVKGRFPRLYPVLRAPLFAAEWAGQALPNTSNFSPYAAVIARKPG